jgi:RNA polymerase sigma factor (sigma-70 family)
LGEDVETPEDGPHEERSGLEREFFALLGAERPGDAHRLLHRSLRFAEGWLLCRYGGELGGRPGVEELVHDAACRALERIDGYRPGCRGLLFWSWTIALHLALDRVRSERARREREQEVARPEASEQAQLQHDVREAIAQLPEHFQTLLRLDLEYGGHAPIAVLVAALGVAPQTIYNWRTQARKALRERLQ